MVMADVSTLFVHGIGVWPGVFGPVVDALAGRGLLWTRPGYGIEEPSERPQPTYGPPELSHQVEALAAEVERVGPAVVVGVGEGASLALAAAIDGAPGVVGVVTHEPLIGPLEPVLHREAELAAHRLSRQPGPEAAVDHLRGRFGSRSWYLMSEPARRWSAIQHRVVCAEVEQFTSFQPTREQLAELAVPNLTTVGSRSPSERQRVASLLVRTGQGRTTSSVIDACGHLAPVDAPDGLAAAIKTFRTTIGLTET
jgi:pimeloyl-ACP methyl ester carboxylesterase